MATKRKRELADDQRTDSLEELLSALKTPDSAARAFRYIMNAHDIDLDKLLLEQLLREPRTTPTPPTANYADIAPALGLDPARGAHDIPYSALPRARVPTPLFREIVRGIDAAQAQLGPPTEHHTAAARARFLAPIFSRLVAVFDGAYRSFPACIPEGRIASGGAVEHNFKAFGARPVLLVEYRRESGFADERLGAIAHVAAACDAADRESARKGLGVPVRAILCDGDTFEVFAFDGSTNPPAFSRGRDIDLRSLLELPKGALPRDFIRALRPICEVVFDVLLGGYVASAEAYRRREAERTANDGQPRPSSDKWEAAIGSAQQALEKFREADVKRRGKLVSEANALVEEAMGLLKSSTDWVPDVYRPPPFMSGWDEEQVDKI
ncbi:hypothetical protein HWV62_5496 [Athelia sp. TMB]|nr:hypothetical protein HWV62_5496 [Athelia sp. TMB]